MKTLTDKIEKSNNIITNVQSEVINVKKDTKTYKQSLGKVNLRKSVSIPEKTSLGYQNQAQARLMIDYMLI